MKTKADCAVCHRSRGRGISLAGRGLAMGLLGHYYRGECAAPVINRKPKILSLTIQCQYE